MFTYVQHNMIDTVDVYNVVRNGVVRIRIVYVCFAILSSQVFSADFRQFFYTISFFSFSKNWWKGANGPNILIKHVNKNQNVSELDDSWLFF